MSFSLVPDEGRPWNVRLDAKNAALNVNSVVRTLRHHPLLRTAIVALLIVSWVLFTNHCALGMMRTTLKAGDTSAHCCGGMTNPKQAPPNELRMCCKVKVTGAFSKVAAKFDTSQFALQIFAPLQSVAPAQTTPRRLLSVCAHAPPRSISFAESVLQRGLLSHAPPFAV